MKIERISDTQIRCTLNKNDLRERHLKISELAYGSAKAKELFRDMMEQANIDVGFEANDIPIMIEAIPTSKDSIILVITKVENQDELDAKFSQFGLDDDSEFTKDFNDINLPYEILDNDMDYDEDDEDDEEENTSNQLDSLADLLSQAANSAKDGNRQSEFIPLSEALHKTFEDKAEDPTSSHTFQRDNVKLYSFISLEPIITVAKRCNPSYNGSNTLWKNQKDNRYFLMLKRGKGKRIFRSVCAMTSEYGTEETLTYASANYFDEHFQLIIKDKALSQLAKL